MEKLHIQPSELDMLPFYEYEYTFDMYKEITEERNRAESDAQNAEQTQNPNTALKGFKQPKMPSIKTPSIKVPKF